MDSSKKISTKEEIYSLFNLPQEILESLKIYNEQIEIINTDSLPEITSQQLGSDNDDDFDSTEDSSISENKKKIMCNKCKLTFKDYQELRNHYHSDLHKKNVLKALNNEEISDEEFSSKLSLEDSQYSDSEGSSLELNEDDKTKTKADKGQSAYLTKDQPFVALEMDFSKVLLIYKSVLYFQQTRGEISISEKEIKARIHALQKNNWGGKPFYWTIILLSSGHFAGGVVDCSTGKMVVKKTFHRYTTRRKQGGSQASNDNAKGKAKSAGANLRRYNEQMIEQEVKEVMTEWKDYVKTSDLVFIHTSNTNRKIIINSTDSLTMDDPRIRNIPFTTGRPTLNELSTIFNKLSSTYIKNISEVKLHTVVDNGDEDESSTTSGLQKSKNNKDTNNNNKKSNNKKIGKNNKRDESEEDVNGEETIDPKEEELSKLKYLCKKGLVDMFQKQLESSNLVQLNEPFYNDEEGITLLHIASAYGQSEMVDYLLEAGADPTIKLKEGDKFTGKVNLNTHIKSESSALKRFNMLMNMTAYDMASDKETRNTFRRYYYRHQDQWNYQDAHITSFLSPEMEEEATRKKQKKKTDKKRRLQSQKKKQASKAAKEDTEDSTTTEEESSSTTKKPSGSKSVLRKLGQSTLNTFGMSLEMRQRLDREKRAQAAMNRLKAASVSGGVTSSTASLFVKQEDQTSGNNSSSNSSNGPCCFMCQKPFTPGQVPFSVMDKQFCSTNCVRVFRLSSNN
ncbi:hypothetical protein BCR32DRAFT_291565 [Anaeromyces robustus]|uniref:VLRF1 domain-containing protein n=1 Tax=Anaeromyces robustus TaxID=1754192 RepID=A0A1Y1XE84_9FUNG|nr:hypothetical protein BCR32DRAFT_291565 [Anaeromyces robustus]|eukprot:ORX84070.1 hypothetical protein BCR32DRAFT_291565 [Anaeromyces robustus]